MKPTQRLPSTLTKLIDRASLCSRGFLAVALVLLGGVLPLSAATLDASIYSLTTAPNFRPSYTATGNTINITLSFQPPQGATLPVLDITTLDFIVGRFSNLAQGQAVALTYAGVTYNYVANYYGGSGNDLVLAWADNRALAWGRNDQGQLGNSSTSHSSLPIAVVNSGVLAGKTILATALGGSHSLALCSDGTLAAWGRNAEGQLGDGSTTQRNTPVAVSTAAGVSALNGKTIIAIAAGENHSLALCSDGSLAAWGWNQSGQLGDGTTTSRSYPTAVNRASGSSALFGRTIAGIAAGYQHSLARCTDGSVTAWGYNNHGQIGDNSTTNRSFPVAVNAASGSSALYGLAVMSISAGVDHSMALTDGGQVITWGGNSYGGGALGDGTTTDRWLPVFVNTTPGSSALYLKYVTAIAAGGYHCLALCSDGLLVSWGYNAEGNIGDGTRSTRTRPVAVNISYGASALFNKVVTAISAGHSHSLAVSRDGAAASWGRNDFGQLADSLFTDRALPGQVDRSPLSVGGAFTSVTGGFGSWHTLAIVANPSSAGLFKVTSSAAANGTIYPTAPQAVSSGGSVRYLAQPGTGFMVDTWVVDGLTAQTGGTAFTLANVTANRAVQVTFKTLTYTVTPASTGHGIVVANGGTDTASGGSLSFTATPDRGYEVEQWWVNGAVAQQGGTTLTVSNIQASRGVTATFRQIPTLIYETYLEEAQPSQVAFFSDDGDYAGQIVYRRTSKKKIIGVTKVLLFANDRPPHHGNYNQALSGMPL